MPRVADMTRHKYNLLAIIALISGIVTIVSLFLPWANVNDELLNAFQMGNSAAESVKMAFVTTTFDFIAFFGGLTIVGAVLMLMNLDVGVHLITVGSFLTIIFTVLGLWISSLLPLVTPYIGGWICLSCGVAGIVSPKLRKKEQP
jgi:hypothetical protein